MADSALPPPPLTPPSQLFSFTDWSISHPQAPPPGDRLDAQFNEVTRAIQILIDRLRFLTRDDGQLTNYSVGLNSLDQGLAALIVQGQQPLVPPPDINQAINDAFAARDAVQASREAIEAIAHDVANHVIDAAQANDKAQEALLAAAAARNAAIAIANQFPAAQAELNALLSSDIRTTSSATDAEQLAWKWAEKLDGPVLTEAEYAAIDPALKPPGYQYNPVGGVNGLWSSHWWSIQARDAVGDASSEADRAEAAADDAAAALDQFTDLYLGPHPANPTLDNDGNPLQVGAVYYNTNDGNMYVWSGTQWTVSSSAKGWVPEAPIDSHTYVRGNASWLLSAGGIGEAPNNGNAYARKSVAWSQLNSNDVVFDTGPTMVTGAVNLKADKSALDAETTARIAGDQANTASINNLKASQIANDSSVAGTTVKDALNTNLGAINANASAITLKADITAMNLKANIASPVFTGDPQAPTPAPGDNDTSIPTTAWVNTAVGAALALKPSVIVSATPPGTPIDNAMWWESDTGYLFLRYNDGNSAQWVQLNGIPAAAMSAYVAKTGDTMTGALTIATPGAGTSLILNKPVGGFANNLVGRVNGLSRWIMQLGTGVLESTGNVGSDFAINRYDDSGVLIDVPFSINRATGSIISAPPTGIYGLTVQPPVGGASLLLNKSAGNYPVTISSQTAGKARWQMVMGSGDETGSGNGGGDFYLQNYNDAGALLLNALTIARSSGQATFGTTMRASGFNCRTGVSGGFGGSNFNFNWTTTAVQVWIDNSNLGNMTYTSDYRIKKDVAPLTPMWETVKALRPISYTHQDYTPPTAVLKEDGSPADPMFTNDDTERWGFIAHELQETLTESAATGFKDSPDHIQSPNPWTMLAAVTKALQEAMQRIEALEARMV